MRLLRWQKVRRMVCETRYLQVVVQAAAEVHLPERHVGQLGVEEDAQLGADVQRRPPGHGLLLGGDVDLRLVELPQVLLQRQAHASPQQLRLRGAAACRRRSAHHPAQGVWGRGGGVAGENQD